MKRTALTTTLILAFLLSAVAGAMIANSARANPYLGYDFNASPPTDMQPQMVTILSPKNMTGYASNNSSLSFRVSLNSTNTWYHIHIDSVYYKASWQDNNVSVYSWSSHDLWNPFDNDPYLSEFLYELNLTEIPEGRQNITVTAYAIGSYEKSMVYHEFPTNISSSVIFIIDTTPTSFPTTSIIAASGASMATSGVGLLFNFKKRKR